MRSATIGAARQSTAAKVASDHTVTQVSVKQTEEDVAAERGDMRAGQDHGDPIAHWTIVVTGTVQGVFFRAGAREQAQALGLSGEARNMPDGSVRIEVEGSVDRLKLFRDWFHHGPPKAVVNGVDVVEGPLQNYPPGTF